MKRTKIVATMGPACSDKEVLRKMLFEGVNVCRVNFSLLLIPLPPTSAPLVKSISKLMC